MDMCPNVCTTLVVIGAFYAVKLSFNVVLSLYDVFDSNAISPLVSRKKEWWIKQYGEWAVVTGSSEGIGYGYAYELAQRGVNIVLMSRSESKLQRAKAEIESTSNVKVEYIVADFATANENGLYERIETELADKEIGLLVNNVGTTYSRDVLLNVRRHKLWDIINVNVGAATIMTHMLLPAMVTRGKGGIVVVTSGTTVGITPHLTVYAATKKYLEYFIQSVAYEYRHSGVTFQCLIPFVTLTRMTGFSETDSKTKSSFFTPDASTFAKSAIRTLGRSPYTAGYFAHSIQLWFTNIVPSWLWTWAVDRLNTSHRTKIANLRSKKST